jgi:single-strand DNA-binding protein
MPSEETDIEPERRLNMPNYNRVVIVGNVVRDPDLRYVQSGSAVAKFTVAVNHQTRQGDVVDFIDVVAWDGDAERSNSYLRKGMPVLVEGRLAIRAYESKGGEKHKAAEVVMSHMQMLNRVDNHRGDGAAAVTEAGVPVTLPEAL